MLENRTRLHVSREPKAPPLRLLFSYCRLLPPREIAKSFSANGMVGRGGGDRTRSPVEFVMIYRAQAEIGMWPRHSQQTACRHRYSIVAFYRLDTSPSPRTAVRFTVWA